MGCYESRVADPIEIEDEKVFTVQNQFNFYAGIKGNNIALIKELIRQKYNINYLMPHFAKRTPLHLAADFGLEEMIGLLVMHGANVNKPDPYGVTPILLAAQRGHRKCVLLLYKLGANIKLKTAQGTRFEDYVPEEDKIFYVRELKKTEQNQNIDRNNI